MNSSPAQLARLSQIPVETARIVARAHDGITTDEYKTFLNTMYHYTLRSRERLERAAALSPHDDLREFFRELASEEASHYMLAEADLKAMDGELVRDRRPPSVEAFEQYWAEISDREFAKFLGALYVLESVGEHLKQEAAVNMASLKLTKLQARFVLVHLKEDVEHGSRTRALCEKYFATHEADILAGADEASRHWAAIMCEGFRS